MTMKPSDILRKLIQGEDALNSPLGKFADWPGSLQSALRLILAADAQLTIFAGPDMVALYNDAYVPVIGDKHPGALGRPAREYWAELWDDLGTMLHSVYESGESISAKDRPFYIERHGFPEITCFDICFSPISEPDGTIHGVLCIVSETTERVKAAAELRRSDGNLRAIVQSASVGLAQVDGSGQLTMVNAQFAALLNTGVANLTGTNVSKWVMREDQEEMNLLFGQPGGPQPKSLRFIKADGQPVWLSCTSSPVAEDASWPTGAQYCLIALDLTTQLRDRARERQMVAIIEGSLDAILALDLAMKITAWNRGAARLYGYEPDEIIGQPVHLLLPTEFKDEEDKILARIRRGEKVESYETRRCRKDGSEVPVSLTVSPIYNEHGQIIGASKIARDVSARLETERMQTVLVREMKHRVKNTLATVLAIARQTLGKSPDPVVPVFNNRIYALARAQDLITREVRDAALISEMVAQVIEPYSGEQFLCSGPRVELNSGVVLPLTLALHELATNAAKHGALSQAGSRIHVDWSVGPGPEGEMLTFTWTEQGGPPVLTPSHTGFGTVLIRDIVAAELSAKVRLEYDPKGLIFEVIAPLAPIGSLHPEEPDEGESLRKAV